MLKILDVIPVPTKDNTIGFSIYKNSSTFIGEDTFCYYNFKTTIDSVNTKRIIILAIFERDSKQIYVEAKCLLTSNNLIYPISIRFRDSNSKDLNNNNELVVLSNINNLHNYQLIHYSEDDFYNRNIPFKDISISSFYNKIVPTSFWEIIEYCKDPSYSGYTKLAIPEYSYSLVSKLEGAIHINEIYKPNINVFNTNKRELFKDFEYILFNMDMSWTIDFIKELKYHFLDVDLVNKMIKFHRRVPMLISPPKEIVINRSRSDYISPKMINIINKLTNIISDFSIVYRDIIYTCNIDILYAYSSTLFDVNLKIDIKKMFQFLRKDIVELIDTWELNKSKVPINVEVKKNFYGDLVIIVNVQNEPKYYFYVDLFLYTFAAEGIDINF